MAVVTVDHLYERLYVSQYTTPTVGVQIRIAGDLADPDGNAVAVAMVNAADDEVFSRAATRVETGTYQVTLDSQESAVPGEYRLDWTYEVGGDSETFSTYIEVGYTAPDYDRLPDSLKEVVEQTWVRFIDLFDSPNGGPHLQTYLQTGFGRNRMAQMLRIAVGKLNTMAQPHQTYTITAEGTFPVDKWGALLEEQLFVEVVKHLIRSYTEMPSLNGNTVVSYFDRRDYTARWREVLQDEQQVLDGMFDTFKLAHMGFGSPNVLVSGGVYGEYGPTRLPGSAAARPRYWTRWY